MWLSKVYAEVMKSISKNNIEVLVGWELIDWHVKSLPQGRMIEAIVIRLRGKTRTLDCDAFLNFREKTIDMRIFLGDCQISTSTKFIILFTTANYDSPMRSILFSDL